MNAFLTARGSPFLVLLFAAHTPDAFATRISLRVDVPEKSSGVAVLAEGRELCVAKKAAPSCEFDLPKAGEWTVRVNPARGMSAVRVIDIGPAVGKLDAPAEAYGERFARFIQATAVLVREQMPDLGYALVESAKPATQADIDAAAKRLGFALPADFVSLQRRLGTLTMEDHNLMAIADVDNAYAQMRKVWGTPEEAMQSDYSAAFREVLKHSTLLFTEVGDGLGGLLYRPGNTRACGASGTYYWTSQEGGTELLRDADGRCMDFAAAMRWIVNGFVVDSLAETLSEGGTPRLLIDSSLPSQQVSLHMEGSAASARAAWLGPNL